MALDRSIPEGLMDYLWAYDFGAATHLKARWSDGLALPGLDASSLSADGRAPGGAGGEYYLISGLDSADGGDRIFLVRIVADSFSAEPVAVEDAGDDVTVAWSGGTFTLPNVDLDDIDGAGFRIHGPADDSGPHDSYGGELAGSPEDGGVGQEVDADRGGSAGTPDDAGAAGADGPTLAQESGSDETDGPTKTGIANDGDADENDASYREYSQKDGSWHIGVKWLENGFPEFFYNYLSARGGKGNDELLGSYRHNMLHGDSGNDTLIGSGGFDTLYGGSDNDLLFGDAGSDSLDGGSGNDVLIGGSGSDLLDGGTGVDRLIGGSGSDVFVFAAADGDTIGDFEDGIDRIMITTDGIDGVDDLRISGEGKDIRISWDNGGGTTGSIILQEPGIDHSLLDADDFIFDDPTVLDDGSDNVRIVWDNGALFLSVEGTLVNLDDYVW